MAWAQAVAETGLMFKNRGRKLSHLRPRRLPAGHSSYSSHPSHPSHCQPPGHTVKGQSDNRATKRSMQCVYIENINNLNRIINCYLEPLL